MRVDNRNIVGILTLVLMLALMGFSFFEVFNNYSSYPNTTIINLSLDLFGIIICTIVFASTLLDQHINISTIVFMCILTLEELLLFWNIESWIVDGNPSMIFYNKITNYYAFGFHDIITLTFWVYLKGLYTEHRKEMHTLSLIIYGLFTFGMLIIITNPWTEFLFVVDDVTGVYSRCNLFALSYIAPYLMMSIFIYTIIKFEGNLRRKCTLCSYIVLPLIGSIIQIAFSEISLQIVLLMFAIFMMYTNVYIERSAEFIQNETNMSEQRASVMVSQIQPHFMYNALTSIMNIKGNPVQTRDAIADFGKYLRGNLDSISQINPVPLSREIDQLRSYIELRKIKHGEHIKVNIDIDDNSFFIPPMTVKTIVGKAIEYHMKNEEFFLYCDIYTESNEKEHILVIEDIFPFDKIYEYIKDDTNPDIELVENRLRTMVNGYIENVVEPDGELKSIIHIPRNEKVKP